jgi:hypothetical protein
MKKCFVISPIGKEDSPEREHANDVLDYIITPALEQCKIKPIRSDHLSEPGLISNHMFDAILNYDMCIAILTFKNPNVYYELAIAQAANRPVLILLEKGEDLPFDIKDLRCVYYDLKPRPLFEQEYVKQIVKFINSFEASGWKVPNTIPGLFTATQEEDMKYFEMSQSYGTHVDWGNILSEAEEKFEIMGISLMAWRRVKDLSDRLLAKSEKGCKIKILLMDKENPSLSKMINTNIEEMDFNEVCSGIDNSFNWYTNIANKSDYIEVRQIREGIPFHTQYLNDKFGIYIPYFYSETTGYTPLWRADHNTHMYNLLTKEFEQLWNNNK